MPVVHVNVWEGFGKQRAKITIQNITKVFVDLGIPQPAVEVIIHEIPAGNPHRKNSKTWGPNLFFPFLF
jgi:phenylpyruvate tautomerase PptA (4-oxalocrotonate tautomerase family)